MEPLEGLEFGPIEADGLMELRLLNDTTFPVRYNEKFYAEVLTTRPEYTKYGASTDRSRTAVWRMVVVLHGMELRSRSMDGCLPRSTDSPSPHPHPLTHAAAYWKGQVVGAICCRLENHDVPGCVCT